MNVIGENMKIIAATDPTLVGKRGLVVLDTANTLVLSEGTKSLRVPKTGTQLVTSSGVRVAGSDLSGRLEDRLGRER